MSRNDCTLVHEKTLKVLAETGIRFDTDLALDVLRKHGVKLSGKTAFFTALMVEEAIAQTPKKFKWIGRNNNQDLIEGEELVVLPNVGNVYLHCNDG